MNEPMIEQPMFRLSTDATEWNTMQYPYSTEQVDDAIDRGILWGGFFEWETLEYAE